MFNKKSSLSIRRRPVRLRLFGLLFARALGSLEQLFGALDPDQAEESLEEEGRGDKLRRFAVTGRSSIFTPTGRLGFFLHGTHR